MAQLSGDILEYVENIQNTMSEQYVSSDREWNKFGALCQLLQNVCFNKLNFEAHEEKEFVDRFMRIKRNEERVKFVIEDSRFGSMISFVLQMFVAKRVLHSKDALKSRAMREEGNKYFKDKKFVAAVECYSEAILNAPHPTENGGEALELTLAYGNRSAAYFQLKRYADCLYDVEEAINTGFPVQRLPVLLQRKGLCLNALAKRGQNNQKPSNGQKVDLEGYKQLVSKIYANRRVVGKNEVIKCGAEFIQLRVSPEKGRYLSTIREVAPNEVLLVESPYASFLKPSLYCTHCNHCCKSLEGAFVPCKVCSKVRYCDLSCRDSAWSQYHSVECNILDLLEHLSKGHLAARILFTPKINAALEVVESDGGETGESTSTLSEPQLAYKTILGLVDHGNKFDFDTNFENTLGAVFMTFLLREMDLLGELDTENDYRVASRFLHHINQINLNGIQIIEQKIVQPVDDGTGKVGFKMIQKEDSLGLALYPSLSLLNHSCYNTTISLFNGNQLTFTSSRHLKAGDEVTFNYGPHYKVCNIKERQEFLSKYYFFDCTCTACQENWEG